MVSAAVQTAARAELRRMTSQRGERKRVAFELGRSEPSLSRYVRGKAPIPADLSVQILMKVRLEELILADKLESEITGERMSPRFCDFPQWCAQCERTIRPSDAKFCQSQWCKAR
jgi:predicted transcriptional regulator